MHNETAHILAEIERVIVGKSDTIKKVLTAILSDGHILLEDVPGVGKTTLALCFSKALGLDYRRIQFTADTMPSDVTGFSVFSKSENKFVYQQGPVVTNLLLADEINRTSSKTQAALLEVMEEKKVTVDGETHNLPDPFIVIATQNPVGSAGTQLLPQSQLDRFMVKLKIGYPDFESQVNLLKDRHIQNPLDYVKTVVSREELSSMRQAVKKVYISDEIYEYITSLAIASSENKHLELGVSPRGSLAVCRFAKAHAYLQNRDYVIPTDIKQIYSDVCAHRVVLNRKAKIAGLTASQIIDEILNDVSMPLEDKKRRNNKC